MLLKILKKRTRYIRLYRVVELLSIVGHTRLQNPRLQYFFFFIFLCMFCAQVAFCVLWNTGTVAIEIADLNQMLFKSLPS